jgi:hypothetical protein
MALRFRRRIKIFPGVHLNISRSGISTSVGVRGASITLGKRGTYLNTGIPGSGVSWRGRIDSLVSAQTPPAPIKQQTPIHTHHLHWWKVLLFIATMLLAGATKSNAIIGIFWIGWFGFWLFLLIRLVSRSVTSKNNNGQTEGNAA